MLTSAQLTTLKTDIAADGALNALPNDTDNNILTADAYNAPALPSFWVWKTSVPISDVGKNIDGAELAGLTGVNNDRLRTLAMYLGAGVNPSLADHRAFFDDIFSGAGGALTRPRLLALWKRLASRAEKLYADTSGGGTGAEATPAKLVFEGHITYQDVNSARNLP